MDVEGYGTSRRGGPGSMGSFRMSKPRFEYKVRLPRSHILFFDFVLTGAVTFFCSPCGSGPTTTRRQRPTTEHLRTHNSQIVQHPFILFDIEPTS
jgi:hypothetical protein